MEPNPPMSTAPYDPRHWFSISKGYDNSTTTANNTSLPPLPPPQTTNPNNDPRLHRDAGNANSGRNDYGASTNNHIVTTASLNNTSTFTPASVNATNTFTPAPAPPTPTTPPNNDHMSDAPTIDQGKLELYIRRLQEMVTILPQEYRKKFPYDMICELAHSFMDGTVFEITHGLSEIQTLTESNLNSRRTKLIESHRVSKKELLLQQKQELAMFERKPHQLKVMTKQHEDALAAFTQQCQKEVNSLDQKLVLELDRQVSDQQSTLQRAGLPFFFITNEPEEIKVQMYLLSFITKLSAG